MAPLHCLLLRGPAATVVRCWSADTRLNDRSFTDAVLSSGDRLGIGPIELEVLGVGATSLAREPEIEQEETQRAADEQREQLAARLAELEAERNALAAERDGLEAQRNALAEERRQWQAEQEETQREIDEQREQLARSAELESRAETPMAAEQEPSLRSAHCRESRTGGRTPAMAGPARRDSAGNRRATRATAARLAEVETTQLATPWRTNAGNGRTEQEETQREIDAT